jgi:hypothetical protein
MARGRGAGRNALSEAKVGELIRGNQEALQKQAAVGGNAPKALSPEAQLRAERRAKGLDENTGEALPPGIIAFDSKTGSFLPGPGATKEQVAAAQALIDQMRNGLTKAQPNNTTPLPTSPSPNSPFSQEDMDTLKQLQQDEASEKAFKEYLQSKMDRSAFETEMAAEKAKQEAFERFVRGQQSAAGAAKSASNPANSAKAKQNPQSTEPKGEEAKQAKEETPWWKSSGGGPRFLFGGAGAGGEATMGGGAVEARAAAGREGASELLKKQRARVAAKGSATPPPSAPPAK